MTARILALLFALVVFATPARATNVSVCLAIHTAWEDLDGGDIWLTDADHPARGIFLVVHELGVSCNNYGNFVSDDTGCATVSVTLNHHYEVYVFSWASVNGVTMWVDQTESGLDVFQYYFYNAGLPWTPVSSSGLNLTLTENYWDAQLLVAMAIMHGNNFGLAGGEAFLQFIDHDDVDDDDDGDGVSADPDCCFNASSDGYIRAHTMAKWTIAHEIGHAINIRREADNALKLDYGFDPDFCDGDDVDADPLTSHSMTEAEYQSAAVLEGWADFVAAWAFNSPQGSDADCEFDKQYNTDFDLDGVKDNTSPPGVFDCDSVPKPGLESYVSASDWLQDLVDTTDDPLACDETTTATISTEFDALRYFWDMHADWDVPADDLADILDLAEPDTWDQDNNLPFSDGSTGTTDDVIVRLEYGADQPRGGDADGYDEEHDSCKVNGQTH